MMSEFVPGQAPAPGNPTPTAPAAAPAAAPVAAPVAAPAAAPATVDQPFYSGFQDETLKTWAEGKNWQSPEAAVKSAFHLEKMVGAPAEQVLRRPVDGDVEGIRTLRQQLGAPTDAGEYTIPGLDGTADETSKAYGSHMSTAFLEAGLTQDQVNTVMTAGTAFLTQAEEAQTKDHELAVQAEKTELQREWGAGYEKNQNLGIQAAEKLGFTGGIISAIEDTVGFAETMKLFADLGTRLGEDNFVNPNLPTHGQTFNGDLSPAQAKEQWNQFTADPNNITALTTRNHPGHGAAMARKSDLFKLMHPEA